jgi:putative CocE/NonD family hydrolase
VLIYTTDPLEQELEITGNVKGLLFVSSDADDTDVAIRLVDVYPDGRSMLLADGIQRLSLRESFREHSFLTPGRVYEAEVRTPSVATTFLAGHSIRLIVSASNHPRFELNTRARDSDGTPRKVTNTLYHDPDHPSALILPVLAAKGRTGPVTVDRSPTSNSRRATGA